MAAPGTGRIPCQQFKVVNSALEMSVRSPCRWTFSVKIGGPEFS
jgi:hypothetical protein